MWKSKKFIIIAVIVAVLLVGGIAGVAIAQTSSNNNATAPPSTTQTFAARVAKILGIDQQKVQSAFDQARKDMANDALDARLKALVAQGKITQSQADQYKSWWQSRPNMNLPMPGRPGRYGRMGWLPKGAPSTSAPTPSP